MRRAVAAADGDLRRSYGFGLGALVLVATVGFGLAALHGPRALAAPGPVMLPHRELACEACHGESSTSSACTGCHGAHASRRAAHRELAERGELDCRGCHDPHGESAGVELGPNGRALFYASGLEKPIAPNDFAGAPTFDPNVAERERVPLVARSACSACHELERASDPASACFPPLSGGELARYNTCFDEHRAPAAASSSQPAARDRAIELSRLVLGRAPGRLESSARSSAAPVLIGGLCAALAIALRRRRSSRVRANAVVTRPRSVSSARRLPVIDANRCLGCSACVDACPYDVLEVRRYVAVVSRPELCCGVGSCLERCPNGSLSLRAEASPPEAPKLSPVLESLERPGLYFAGDAAGGSLIRGAVEQGTRVARAIIAVRRGAKAEPVVVVGAGPAGLSAALTLERAGVRAIVLEQASIAESVRRFSRQKLVLDRAAEREDGEAGEQPLFVGECEKEELLRRWQRTIHRAGLDLREGTRVVSIERREGGLAGSCVRAVGAGGQGHEFSAPQVIIAIGRRGSPKRLAADVPAAALARVHYELSDARAFAGKRVIVVGLGDVAMETALALALAEGTEVTVVHRGRGFTRGKRRNVEALGACVASGRVGLFLESEIAEIGPERVTVTTPLGRRQLSYDALFVHIGRNPSELPLR